MKSLLRDLRWTMPAGLVAGFLFSVIEGAGQWWIGGFAYSAVFFLGLLALAAAWRWACEGQDASAAKTLGLILLLALVVRLFFTVALTYVLPVYGYHGNTATDAGYLSPDAFNRDTQAWKLADSSAPLWKAFDKSYSSDQYGGLLALSAALYRFLSPDAHRPWLMTFLGALVAVIGIAFAWKAVRLAWGETVAKPVAWILALYPEAFLQASSQTREPFLMTFIAISLWGVVDWQIARRRSGWYWAIGGLVGLMLFNPTVAIFALVLLGGWLLIQWQGRRIPWKVVLGVAVVATLAVVLLWLGLSRGALAGKSPLEVFSRWLGLASKLDTFMTVIKSGAVQQVPKSLQVPFVVLYGLLQPLLPAATFETTVWPWRVIGMLRATGWYLLMPFLIASLASVWKVNDRQGRRGWVWLMFVTIFWLFLSSFRAGGDLWDNPRYRVIFLLFEALLAANAWIWWRSTRNRWVTRLLIVEVVFLAVLFCWYIIRYVASFSLVIQFAIPLAVGVMLSLVVVFWGVIADRKKRPRGKQ